VSYSTLILTKNEAANIRRCLESLAFCDDIIVLDSFSEDETEALVKGTSARFFQRAFDTFAGQRNWAIDNVVFKYRWVLHLDADECLTPQLHAELSRLAADDGKSAYMLANRVIFMGRWIRRCTMYPYYQARFLRLGESRFKQVGHGQHLGHATRGTGIALEPYTHYNFSKGIADWVARHNRYSDDEARRITRDDRGFLASLPEAIVSRDAGEKQQARKRLADHLPLRPLVRFLYLYVWKWGFLDGRAGFDYCMLMAFYDYLIRLKVIEHRQREMGIGA
jgi:glycosyltransferase involved in cell wall biosynthesis